MKRFALLLAALLFATPCFAATHTVYLTQPTGGTYYAYPVSQSLASWATYRVALTEASSPNSGRYSGTLDDANGTTWQVFSGSSQPASWDVSLATYDLTANKTYAQTLAAAIRSALGLASANLDTQLVGISEDVGDIATDGTSIDVASADLIAARIVAARGDYYPPRAQVWVLTSTDGEISVKDGKECTKAAGVTRRYYIDFAGVLGRNEAIQAINTLSISGGTVSITADSSGITGNLVYAEFTGGAADDECTIAFDVTATQSPHLTGTVTLNVAE